MEMVVTTNGNIEEIIQGLGKYLFPVNTVSKHNFTMLHIMCKPSELDISSYAVRVRLTNWDYQAKGPTDPFEGTNTHFHIQRGT